ncbi:hypothetical protein [Microcoleus sp.]
MKLCFHNYRGDIFPDLLQQNPIALEHHSSNCGDRILAQFLNS